MTTSNDASQNPPWSVQEERLLWYIALIIVILCLTSQRSKYKWLRYIKDLFVSALGIALLTIFLGGFVGQYITMRFTAYSQKLEQERALSGQIFQLLGICRAASDNLVDSTHQSFKDSASYREKVGVAFNEVNTNWRAKKLELDMLMKYNYGRQEEVLKAWNNVTTAISDYMSHADAWNRRYSTPAATEEEVNAALDPTNLDEATKELTTALENARSDKGLLLR